jgi:hypothetical protein
MVIDEGDPKGLFRGAFMVREGPKLKMEPFGRLNHVRNLVRRSP